MKSTPFVLFENFRLFFQRNVILFVNTLIANPLIMLLCTRHRYLKLILFTKTKGFNRKTNGVNTIFLQKKIRKHKL